MTLSPVCHNTRPAGVLPEHITVSDLCTRCRPDVFWSHRAFGSDRVSLAAFIALI